MRAKLLLIIALGACLLSFRLGGNDLFQDEVMGLRIAMGSPSDVILQAMGDVHPPLHFLILNYWTGLVGVSAISARSLSVLFAVMAILLTFTLARKIFSRETALLSALLVAVSPYIIFYGRLARYYSLVTLLYLLSILLLRTACRRKALGWWIAYGVSSVALIYTNYVGLFALPGGLLYAALKGRRSMIQYIAAVVCIFLAFLPLLPWMFAQSQRYGLEMRYEGLGRYIVEVIGKGAFTCYTLCLGETVLFWNVIVVIPALLLLVYLFVCGIREAISGEKEGWSIWLSFCLVPFLGIAIFSSMPFIGVFSARSVALFPARVVMLSPLVYMIVANGLCRFSPGRRLALSSAVLGIFLYSLINLYYGIEYINEKYVSPWREVADFVSARVAGSDFVASKEKAFWYYYLDGDMEMVRLEEGRRIAGSEPERVWIVERMRGDTTIDRMPRLSPSFPSSYRLKGVYPFQPIDEWKRRIYSRLRGRDVGRFYIEVRVYVGVRSPG